MKYPSILPNTEHVEVRDALIFEVLLSKLCLEDYTSTIDEIAESTGAVIYWRNINDALNRMKTGGVAMENYEYPIENGVHHHIGTTCCGGAGDDCEHERQFDADSDNETQALSEDSETYKRLTLGLMYLEPYECHNGDERPAENS